MKGCGRAEKWSESSKSSGFVISRDLLGSLHWLEGKIEITPRETSSFHRKIYLCFYNKMGSTTNEELENLGLNLKKIQEKFLNEWTGESFRKARLEDKENHENMLTGGKGMKSCTFVITEVFPYFVNLNLTVFFISNSKRRWSIWKTKSIDIIFKVKKIWKVRNVAFKIPDLLCLHLVQNSTLFLKWSVRVFFHSAVLRQRAEEVANLEKELRELQMTAERLVEKRNQKQKHFEQTEGRLQKQQEGNQRVSLRRLGGVETQRNEWPSEIFPPPTKKEKIWPKEILKSQNSFTHTPKFFLCISQHLLCQCVVGNHCFQGSRHFTPLLYT